MGDFTCMVIPGVTADFLLEDNLELSDPFESSSSGAFKRGGPLIRIRFADFLFSYSALRVSMLTSLVAFSGVN